MERKFDGVNVMREENQINNILHIISGLLETDYKFVSNLETALISEQLSIETFGTSFRQKLNQQIKIFEELNTFLSIANLLDEYNSIVKKYAKLSSTYKLQMLLQSCDDISSTEEDNAIINLKSLIQEKSLCEKELFKRGITIDWLNSMGLTVTSIIENENTDTSPQKSGESSEKFLKRILFGCKNYQQALKAYMKSNLPQNFYLSQRLSDFRRSLIDGHFVTDISWNQLYDDIKKIENSLTSEEKLQMTLHYRKVFQNDKISF